MHIKLNYYIIALISLFYLNSVVISSQTPAFEKTKIANTSIWVGAIDSYNDFSKDLLKKHSLSSCTITYYNKSMRPISHRIFQFDKNGNIEQIMKKNEGKNEEVAQQFKYNSKGQLIYLKDNREEKEYTLSYDKWGKLEFNEEQNLEKADSKKLIWEYWYDEDDRLSYIEAERPNNQMAVKAYEYEYDDKNNIISVFYKVPTKYINEKILHFEYNKKNEIIRYIRNHYGKDYSTVVELKYNSKGQLMQKFYYRNKVSQENKIFEYYYEYNSNGLLSKYKVLTFKNGVDDNKTSTFTYTYK